MMIFFTLFTIIALVAIDQLTKALVVLAVKPVGEIPVIKEWLKWTYRENTGAAFSMFSDHREVFLILTTVMIGVCLYLLFAKYSQNGIMCFVLSLIVGGGLGNMIDRIALGYVVDFIQLSFFSAVFNFADCCITVGAAILIVLIVYSIFTEDKKKSDAPEQGEANAAGKP